MLVFRGVSVHHLLESKCWNLPKLHWLGLPAVPMISRGIDIDMMEIPMVKKLDGNDPEPFFNIFIF